MAKATHLICLVGSAFVQSALSLEDIVFETCDDGSACEGDETSLLQHRNQEVRLKRPVVEYFDIDLDLPPRDRWIQISKRYRQEIIAIDGRQPKFTQWKHDQIKRDWMEATNGWWKENPDFVAELQGMVDAVGDPRYTLEDAKLAQLLYEHGAQSRKACSAVLWAFPNGTVIHGRNMDWEINFEMPDGRHMNWLDVTFEATFYRKKQPIIKATMWPGFIGFSTAMLFGGWSFQQSSRDGNYMFRNLQAARNGAIPFSMHIRRLMQTGIYDFSEAVSTVNSGSYIAPQYFVMSGARPHEGVVLTIDREGKRLPDTPREQYLHSRQGAWYLVQTNDDLNKITSEIRRPLANQLLATSSQQAVSPANMEQFMHTSFLFNELTVYTTVMVPAIGYYKTLLPTDPPEIQNGESIMLAGSVEKRIKRLD